MKIYSITLLFGLISGMLHAQENTKIDFGIRLGGNISDVSHKNSDFFDGKRNGLTGGVFAQIPVNIKLIFQPELAFVQKGQDHKYGVIASVEQFVMNDPRRFTYLEIPLNILFRFNENMNLYTGLSPAYLLKATRDISFVGGKPQSYDEIEEGVYDISKWYNRFDLGLNLGLNVSIIDHFILDARYTNGLTPINKGSEYSNGSYHQTFSFSLGYII